MNEHPFAAHHGDLRRDECNRGRPGRVTLGVRHSGKSGRAMLHRAKSAIFLLSLALLMPAHGIRADEAAVRHPTPWPIRHWRNHQPRRSDLTPVQQRCIDRLYMRIEKANPDLIAPAFRKH